MKKKLVQITVTGTQAKFSIKIPNSRIINAV